MAANFVVGDYVKPIYGAKSSLGVDLTGVKLAKVVKANTGEYPPRRLTFELVEGQTTAKDYNSGYYGRSCKQPNRHVTPGITFIASEPRFQPAEPPASVASAETSFISTSTTFKFTPPPQDKLLLLLL